MIRQNILTNYSQNWAKILFWRQRRPKCGPNETFDVIVMSHIIGARMCQSLASMYLNPILGKVCQYWILKTICSARFQMTLLWRHKDVNCLKCLCISVTNQNGANWLCSHGRNRMKNVFQKLESGVSWGYGWRHIWCQWCHTSESKPDRANSIAPRERASKITYG